MNNDTKPNSLLLKILAAFSFVILLLVDPFLNPDMGWHLRAGQGSVEKLAVPHSDWFSFTLPDFAWTNHEWLHDIIFYLLWQVGGWWGIRVWFAALGCILIFAVINRFHLSETNRETKYILSLVIAGLLVAARVLRPQIIGIIGFALVFLVFRRLQRNPDSKSAWWLPLIFLIWANLHASFPVGLLLLGIVLLIELVKMQLLCQENTSQFIRSFINQDLTLTQKSWLSLLVITALCAAATLINPYGIGIYEEIARTLSDPYAKLHIAEWMPTSIYSVRGEAFFAVAALLLLSLAARRERPDLTGLSLMIVFFLFGLTSMRHVTFFMIVALPELFRAVAPATDYIKREFRFIFSLSTALVVIVVAGYAASRMLPQEQRVGRKADLYPVTALEFLAGNEVGKRTFHAFEWGGYLLWHNPENKTFIDGRMTQWPYGEETLLKRYIDTKNLKPGWQDTLSEFDIELVVIPPKEPLARGLELLPNKWKKLYADKTAVVFERTT